MGLLRMLIGSDINLRRISEISSDEKIDKLYSWSGVSNAGLDKSSDPAEQEIIKYLHMMILNYLLNYFGTKLDDYDF